MRTNHLVLLLALAGAAPAGAQVVPSRNVELLAHRHDYSTGVGDQRYSACWGYVHPDGREYAILGTWEGTALYNITVPSAPVLVGFIPGPKSLWREAKAYRNWIYIVTEGEGVGQGLQIVRMTDPDHPVLAATYVTGFTHSHTVAVDTARAILVCNGTRDQAGLQTGLRVLSLADPEAPVELATWPPGVYPSPIAQYAHDSVPVGDRLYVSSIYDGRQRILDFADPANPTELSSWPTPGAYTHNAWPDASGNHLYVTDERTGFKLAIYDISSVASPFLVYEFTPNPEAIVHNAHVLGDELYLSSYTEGIRVLDLSDPSHPAEFAWADSYPGMSGGFSGVWEVFPYFPSGTVIASDRQTGLYVYRVVRDYGLLRAEVRVAPSSSSAPACGIGGSCCCAPAPCTCANHVGSGAAGFKVFLTAAGSPSAHDSLVTGPAGVAVFGPSPGSYTLRFANFGYTEAEATRLVAVGSRDTVLFDVQLKPTAPFAGTITRSTDQAPLAEAEVHLAYTTLHQHTNALGQFQLDAVPDDDYLVHVQRPGYVPIAYTRHIGPGYGGQDFRLIPGSSYDPLEAETGWEASLPGDDAISGRWIRVDPVGTALPLRSPHPVGPAGARDGSSAAEGVGPAIGLEHEGEEGDGAVPGAIQPESDRTPEGTMCFVTGDGGNPDNPDERDLDQGRTTLTSPSMDLTGMSIPAIAYWLWYYASPPDPMDYLLVELSNDDGQTWTPVDTTRGILNHWQERVIRVADTLPPSSQMKLRFVAQDAGDAITIVEAAIDDVMAFDAATPVVGLPPTGPGASLRFRRPAPNPSRESVRFAIELPTPASIVVEIVDVQGRIVKTLHRGPALAGLVNLSWDGRDVHGNAAGSGLYFARARAGGAEARTRFVRVVGPGPPSW
jgi:choice-of-anchor B domain-containing protein